MTLAEFIRKEEWAVYKIDGSKRQFFGDTFFGPMWKPIPTDIEVSPDFEIDGFLKVEEWLKSENPQQTS